MKGDSMLEKSKVITGMLAFLFFAFLSIATSGQSGDSKALEVMETLQEHYEESIEGIDDYVLVKEQNTIYHKKAYDDGRPYFKTKTKTKNMEGVESASARNEDLYSEFTGAVKDKATYEGKGEVEGHNVHILYVDKLELEGFDDDQAIDQTIEDLYLYIDPDNWVIRQMEYTAEFKGEEGKVREVSPVIQNRDYRDVEGMMIPYETSITVEGLTLSDEERQQAKEGLKKFEEMPESQKEMMQDMMGDKVEKYRKMIKEDRYESVEKVEEVRVNTGLEDF